MGDFRACRQSENVDETKTVGQLSRIMPNSSSPSNAQPNQVNLGNSTQIIDASVDGEGQIAQPSRARAQLPNQAEAFGLAAEIENQPHQGASVRDIILAHPKVRELAVAAAVRALVATKFYFDKKSGQMVHEPDYATQIKAVTVLVSYSDGLPAQTNINFNASMGKSKRSENEEAALALSSPALREELKRQIIEAEKRDRSSADKKSAVSV